MTTDCNEVFQYLRQNPGDYLVFLDLDFGQGRLNGIDVAKQIKAEHDNVKIVFVTNHQEMAMSVLSSGVEPFGFLEKTTDMKKLTAGYARYLQMGIAAFSKQEKNEELVELVTGIDEKVLIKKSQIMYLESEKTVSHGITYHTMDGSCITVRDTMEHCKELLGDDFLRVHRSILANRKCMVSLKGNQIHLANGDEIPCAVRMLGEVKACLR